MVITKAQATEAVKLLDLTNDLIDDGKSVMSISREFFARYERLLFDNPRFYVQCLLACVFSAGRIQGIRDERARRAAKNNSKA